MLGLAITALVVAKAFRPKGESTSSSVQHAGSAESKAWAELTNTCEVRGIVAIVAISP